jgi:glutaconate CoA-transferase subunit A
LSVAIAGSATEARSAAQGLAARIPDGALLALAPDYSGCAIAVIRELVRRGARDLRVLGVPQLGLQADILIGAGCVATVETAAVSLGEHGLAPCFLRAAQEGSLSIVDSTCPAIHAGLTASERGVPFMPLRGVLGSDLVRHRPDWRVVDNPFEAGDPILVVPAIRPDVALFHAEIADAEGNVWIGVRRELMTMAHASAATLVSVEEIRPDRLLDDAALAAGTITSLYLDEVAVVRGGAAPIGCGDRYPPDTGFLQRYAELARSRDGFARFLDSWLADG